MSNDYVRGPTYARTARPTFEFKPSATGYTGGGYARVRSRERRDYTPGDGTDDVFVSIHRLAAVAWHLPEGTLSDDVHLADLDGQDVHHTQPDADKRGMPAANGEAWTRVESHADHSSITQSEMRAYGEDAKRAARDDSPDDGETCVRCGDALVDVKLTSDDWEGPACHDCAPALSEDEPIRVVSV